MKANKAKLSRLFDRILDFGALASGIILIATLVLISLSVVLRQLSHPIIWSGEIVEYLMLWLLFLGTAWVLKNRRHVRVELIVDRMPRKNQAIVALVTSIIAAVACLTVAFFSAKIVVHHFQIGYLISRVLMPPSWIVMIIIPIGLIPLTVEFLRQANHHLRTWKAGNNTS